MVSQLFILCHGKGKHGYISKTETQGKLLSLKPSFCGTIHAVYSPWWHLKSAGLGSSADHQTCLPLHLNNPPRSIMKHFEANQRRKRLPSWSFRLPEQHRAENYGGASCLVRCCVHAERTTTHSPRRALSTSDWIKGVHLLWLWLVF